MLNLICNFNIAECLVNFNMFLKNFMFFFGGLLLFMKQPEIFHCSLDYIVTGKTTDAIMSQIPDTIVQILYSDDKEELDRLNRCLQIYVELMNHAKK